MFRKNKNIDYKKTTSIKVNKCKERLMHKKFEGCDSKFAKSYINRATRRKNKQEKYDIE